MGWQMRLRLVGIAVFGPNQKAAQLEGSKIFMKEFLARHNIPTAKFMSFTEPQACEKPTLTYRAKITNHYQNRWACRGQRGDCRRDKSASSASVVDELMAGKFGAAGQKLIIEEFMVGEGNFMVCDC